MEQRVQYPVYIAFWTLLVVFSFGEVAQASDMERVRRTGTLRAATFASNSGYFLHEGEPMGYDYELLRGLAKELDVVLDLRVATSHDEMSFWVQEGKLDVVASALTINAANRKQLSFARPLFRTRQVLVQQTGGQSLRQPLDLIGKKVYVPRYSAQHARIQNLSDEMGGGIEIVPVDRTTDALIREVASGQIGYTVSAQHVAALHEAVSDLDISTPVGFDQQYAWATPLQKPQLLGRINGYFDRIERNGLLDFLHLKYYRHLSGHRERTSSLYYINPADERFHGRLSPYDALIKAQADQIDWDWLLLASLIAEESRFEERAESYCGARGLMQIMPATGRQHGLSEFFNPEHNVRAGIAQLRFLQEFWSNRVADPTERTYFVMASYNAGQGHVLDARRLAKKYGKNPERWADVAEFLRLKEQPRYYNDPVVRYGYCRGSEPYNYVKKIEQRYRHYQNLVPTETGKPRELDKRLSSWRDYLIIKSRIGENELLYRPLITAAPAPTAQQDM